MRITHLSKGLRHDSHILKMLFLADKGDAVTRLGDSEPAGQHMCYVITYHRHLIVR